MNHEEEKMALWEKNQLMIYEELALSSKSEIVKSGRPQRVEDTSLQVFADIASKIELSGNQSILDIGCSTGWLLDKFIEYCGKSGGELYLFDQAAVIKSIKNRIIQIPKFLHFVSGIFPKDEKELGIQRFDRIVVYSVLQYVPNPEEFVEAILKYLGPGGKLLIGDIPNADKKRRFLASTFGQGIHNEYLLHNSQSAVNVDASSEAQLSPYLGDDLILRILRMCSNLGFNSYLLPQKVGLPFNFTRVDILIERSHE